VTEDLRREIESLRDQRAAVHDVLRQVARSEGLQPVLDEIVSVGVPIRLEGELIGVVGVGRRSPGLFADDEVELVSAFADQAAIAIANSRLIEAVERQRTELARFLSPQVAELFPRPTASRHRQAGLETRRRRD
jgi:GAF domain-containing protein